MGVLVCFTCLFPFCLLVCFHSIDAAGSETTFEYDAAGDTFTQFIKTNIHKVLGMLSII